MSESSRRATQRARTRASDGESEADAPPASSESADPFERVLAREREAAPGKKRATASERDSTVQPDESAAAEAPAHAPVARRTNVALPEGAARSTRSRGDDASDAPTIANATTESNTAPSNGGALDVSTASEGATSDVAERAGHETTTSAATESSVESATGTGDSAPGDDVAATAPKAVDGGTNELARAATLARDVTPKTDALHAAHAAVARAESLHSAPLDRATERPTHVPPPAAPPENLQRAADILRQVRLQLAPDVQSAVIHLAPAELGRVSIELDVRKGEVHARVRAEQPEALTALQRHLPELRAALARHGLEAQSFDLALGFRDGQRGREPQPEARRAQRSSFAEELAPVATHTALPLARAIAAGGVDTYA